MIGIPNRIININDVDNLVLNKFSKLEKYKIEIFKINSKKKFIKFVGDIKKIINTKNNHII